MSGVAVERAYADKSDRGHGNQGQVRVMLSGHTWPNPPTKRKFKRRSAIEPTIGNDKTTAD